MGFPDPIALALYLTYASILVLLMLAAGGWARTASRHAVGLAPIAITFLYWSAGVTLILFDRLSFWDTLRSAWVVTNAPSMLVAMVLATMNLNGPTKLQAGLASFLMLIMTPSFLMVD